MSVGGRDGREGSPWVYKATTSILNGNSNEIQSDFSVESLPLDFPQNISHQLEVLLKFAAGNNFILTMCIKSVLNAS